MNAYVTTTGILFGLLVIAHIWRAIAEGPVVAADPIFIFFTILAAAFAFWAWRVHRTLTRSS